MCVGFQPLVDVERRNLNEDRIPDVGNCKKCRAAKLPMVENATSNAQRTVCCCCFGKQWVREAIKKKYCLVKDPTAEENACDSV